MSGERPGSGALVVAALLLGAGLAAGGWLAGRGFMMGRLGDRFVTVKGLSEREVVADSVSWPLTFTTTGNDLLAVQERIEADTARVGAFLERQGFAATDYALGDLRVTDLLAQPWRSEQVGDNRFILTQVLLLRTSRAPAVAEATRHVGELVRQGIVLQEDSRPRYSFTALNTIKPEMIAEATAAARRGAEQFAADSDSRVGLIRRANQGVVSIEARDPGLGPEEWQLEKRVRVVVTLDYQLAD